MAKQDDYSRYTIRVPKPLYAALEEAAALSNRSLNAEIVERLSYAVERKPEEWDKMILQIQQLDDLLDRSEVRLEEVTRHAEVLKSVLDRDFDYQRRLMYHVLSYLNDIPIDLAIWAYDMIASIERTEMMSQISETPHLSETEIREVIQERRDARRVEAMEALKKHLADGG